jgi:chromate reductase, NAD(P)H dehydrogenase (quinone)
MRILGISGSLRTGSYNTLLLETAAELLVDGADLGLFPGLRDVPPYDQDEDRDPAPAGVQRLRNAIAAADAILVATPEYNHSLPRQLKNALDWASRPIASSVLRGKPVGVLGASTSMFGAVWAQAELRKVLAATGARVLDAELPVTHAQTRFDEDGRLRDAELRVRLAELVYALVGEAVPLPVAA